MTVRMNNLLLLFIGFSLMVISCKSDPCGSKDSFLEHFEAFTQEFESKKKDTDEETLQAYEDRYEEIVNTCYKKFKADLSTSEKQEFWKKSLRFYVDRYDGNFSTVLSKKLDDPFNQYLKDELVELTKESGLSFFFSLQEIVKEELPKLMEVFSEEIEKFGQELFGGSSSN